MSIEGSTATREAAEAGRGGGGSRPSGRPRRAGRVAGGARADAAPSRGGARAAPPAERASARRDAARARAAPQARGREANGGGPIYASPSRAPARPRARRRPALGRPAAAARGASPRRTCRTWPTARAPGGGAARRRRRRRRPAPAAASRASTCSRGPGGLREVRPGGARRALAHPADLRAQPGPQLGDDPARHPQRRGRHHRARGLAQAAQRRARARGRQVHDGRRFLVAACVVALKEFPTFNSSLDGDELVLKRYYNIGFAADTPGGLRGPGDQGRRPQGPEGDRRAS